MSGGVTFAVFHMLGIHTGVVGGRAKRRRLSLFVLQDTGALFQYSMLALKDHP